MELINPKSILDVGCGIGTWLSVFQENNISDYLGVDGDYVDVDILKIPQDKFFAQDLQKKWSAHRKFDLVVSLEVAEHLASSYAEQFIETLTKHGDTILFSAAIPGQQGQHHVNEQWLSYWVSIFEKYDYVLFDVLRPKIWNNDQVEVWYKQNMVVFLKRGHHLEKSFNQRSSGYVDIVHPELYIFNSNQAERAMLYEQGKLGIKTALSSLTKAIWEKFR